MVTTVQSIDSRAIAELSPALLRYAMRILNHRQDAEDLVQDTWISALRSESTFSGRSSLRTWLTTILRRRAIDRFRRRRRSLSVEGQVVHEDVQVVDSGHDLTDRPSRGKWETLALTALDGLPALERGAVLLCDVHEIERGEVAQRLGVTRGHLRVLLHRGRGKLEVQLRKLGYSLDLEH